MSSSANQPVWVGTSRLANLGPHPHEAETGGPQQVLDRPTRDGIGTERADVELDRAACLVAVGQHDRARGVRRLGDRGHVVPVAGAVGERRAADERRSLVDRLGKPLRRDRAVAVGPDVHDLRSAQLLRMGDLADRRELVLGDHDPVPLTAQVERGHQPADALRDRGRDRDVVRVGVERAAAIAARNASFRSTQKSHSAPFSSQPASHPSTASRTRCDSAPCEQELRYVAVSKIGNSPRIAAPTLADGGAWLTERS